MMPLQFVAIVGTAMLLLACGRQEEPQGVIPEGYENAVEKAQGVENKLQDAAKAQLDSVEEAAR